MVRHPRHRDERQCLTWQRQVQMALFSFILRTVGIYPRGMRNALDMELVEERAACGELPETLDGFRLLHLSDLHLGRTYPEHTERMAALLNGVKADVCVITGDFRHGHFGPSDHVAGALRKVLSGVAAKQGTYAVLGNHDTLNIGEAIEEAGVRVLYNEGVPLSSGALWLGGVDDPHLYRCDRLDGALRDAPPHAFRVLLAHSPERVSEAAALGVGLYLCGHTHGGQVRLPLLGAVHKNARCRRGQVMGWWREGKMLGHTSPGLGTTDLPVRYLCPPRATMITLRRG